MARNNHPHTLLDQYRQDKYYAQLDKSDAEDALARLHSVIGEERYQAWCDAVLADNDSWLAISRKARQAIDEEGWSVDEADHRQTLNDARPGA